MSHRMTSGGRTGRSFSKRYGVARPASVSTVFQCVKCCSTSSSSSCANEEIALAVTADAPPLLGVGGGGAAGPMTWQFCAAEAGG